MITSQITTSNDAKKEKHISRGEMAYIVSRNQHNAHNEILRAVKSSGKTQKELAHLTGIDEATISRVLRRPSNFQINTVSKIVYAACGCLVSVAPISVEKSRSQTKIAVKTEDYAVSDKRQFFYTIESGAEQVIKYVGPDEGSYSITKGSADITFREKLYA